MSGQWYADPLGRAEHRYYDGTGWTHLVANNCIQTEEDPSLPTTAPYPIFRREVPQAG
jgi:hypothetical protein